MKIILDQTKEKSNLYPFTATRHTADIRIGILTIREKWAYLPGAEVYTEEITFFDESQIDQNDGSIWFDANIIPGSSLLQTRLTDNNINGLEKDGIRTLNHPWEIFQLNDWALREDFELITSRRISQPVSSTNKIIGGENIFLEPGAVVEHSILNAASGPIYIGKNAQVLEGCIIRGPFALCEGAVLKMGSKIYGATTLGPYCVGGGEIKNSLMFGYSNKAHDGYLGDSVIGEWCNLGAGTTNSNVKNNASEVKVWDNTAKVYSPAGLKCGLLMGDYSRSAINTSFNTGTVVGVCCNIFGVDFPPKFVADFSWGKERYNFDKSIQDISNWKKLKGSLVTDIEIKILNNLYNQL